MNMAEWTFEMINTLLAKLETLQKDDTRLEMLFRRLELIQRIVVHIDHVTTECSPIIKLNSLLAKANVSLENYAPIVRTLSTEHHHELDSINSELMNILLELIIDPLQKVILLAEILKNDQKLEQEKYEAEIRERQALRKTLLYVQLADNKEILSSLNQEFGSIIQPYVDRCIEIHSIIPVRGLNNDDIDQSFVSIFYEKEQPIAKKKIRLDALTMPQVSIPVNSTHIQLRADKSTAFERRQARDFLLHTMARGEKGSNMSNEEIWRKLASAPYMPSLLERDRFSNEKQKIEERISPGKAMQTHRWMVILGDPGSGKTTLVRWLALQFAQAFQANDEQGVQLSFLDESTSKLEKIPLGPLRLPITIRLGEYADAVRLNSSLSLFDYIGEHTWLGDSFVEAERNQLSDVVKNYIRAGQTFIVLDGLDEIPESENRSRIVERVETFVEQYVRTPSSVSAFDQEKFGGLGWIALSDLDSPQNAGGNQIIVTSRIVGYHASPLKGSFVHFTIEPLGLTNIEMFIDHWFDGVHRQLLRMLDLTPQERVIRAKVREHTVVLKSEIRNSDNRGLRELTSNSLLLSAICCMSFRAHREGITAVTLPNHRVHLYEDAVEWMLSAWRIKDPRINVIDIKRTLCQLARYIHEKSASGLIDHSTLIEFCRSNLNATVDETSEERAMNFTRIIRDEVGVLAARGEFAYGFLHLTFQEYLTGLAFISIDHSVETVVQRFLENMSNPRYREPLLLALGLISWKWSSDKYDLFCKQLLEEEQHENENFSSLAPLGALLLISSLNDLVQLPSDALIFDAFDQLLLAAGQHHWFTDHPNLAKIIVQGLHKLSAVKINKWALRFLTPSSSRTISHISAFCHCLIQFAAYQLTLSSDVNFMCSPTVIEWVDSRIVNLLWNYLSLENEDEELIIDFTLMQLVHAQPSLFDSPRLRFRSFALIRQQSIPSCLLPLIVAVYGGLDRNTHTNEVVFSAHYIHRDSSLTPFLRRYFLHQNSTNELDELIHYCQRILTNLNPHNCSLKSVDCFLALFCLMGVEERNLFNVYSQHRAFKMAQQRMKRTLSNLCHMYFGIDKRKTTVLTDATNLLNTYIERANPSAIGSVFDYTSALLQATNCLISRKTSFLFAENQNKSKEESSDVMKSPELFQNIDQLENMVLNNMSMISLPKLLRLFWPVVQSFNDNDKYNKCAQLDVCGQLMALGHDHQPAFALAFLPQWLEDIYIVMLKHDRLVLNKSDISLPNLPNKFSLVHVLADISKTLTDNSVCTFSTILTITILYPLFKQVKLESFAASFVWRLSSNTLKSFFNAMTKVMVTDRLMNALDIKDPNLYDLVATLSGEDETEIIRCAIDTELQRYTEIVTKDRHNDCDLYSCALSLSHICWFDATANKWTLFKNALHLTTLVSNIASRLHLITGILSHRSIKSIIHEHVDIRDLLNNQLSTVLDRMSTDTSISPFVTVFLIGRCAEHIEMSSHRKELIQQAIKEFNHLLKCSLPGEAYIFDRFLQSIFPECPSFGSITLHSSKSGLLRRQLSSMTCTAGYSLNEQMTLSACYLANLSFDIHRMNYVSFGTRQLSDLLTTDNDHLSVTVALLVDRWIVSMGSDDLQKLDDFLHNFIYVDPAARFRVTEWLNFDDDKCRFLSFHAALLLARSSMWSPKVMSILCDLLLNEIDQYRQRAENMLQSQTLRWQSSELTWPVFQTLIDKHLSYYNTSAYASLITVWAFEKIEIDDVDHLDKLLMHEKVLINDEQQSRSQLFIIRTVVNRLSSPVLHHFIKIVEDTVNQCTKQNEISLVENTINIQYVLHLFSTKSVFYRATSSQDKMLINMCDRVLINSHIGIPICKAVLFALRYCDREALPLLHSFIVNPCEEVTIVSTAIESYSYRLSSFYYALNDEQKSDKYSLTSITDLLNNPSEEIAKTAAAGLARIYASCDDGLALLMKTLNNDSIKCYTALLNATRDTMVCDSAQHSIEKCAECIEQNTSLLSLFILELYQSIRHYDSTLKLESILFNRGDIQFLEIAALLVKSMSAAFRAEVERCGLTNQIKQALFFTSKQHNFPRRAACIAVLSCFGDLTSNMCNMFLSGLLDTQCSQKTVYECVTRIQHVSEPASLSMLDSFLSSPSMNTRYAVTQLLILLTRQGVIIAKNCQDTLCRMVINMPSSLKNIWLHREKWDWDAITNYECVGRLDKIVYRMLIDMLFSLSPETDSVSSIRNNLSQDVSDNGQLDHCFRQIMKNSECTRLQNVREHKKYQLNVDVDDSDDRVPHIFSFDRRHEHFPAGFFQSLCLKNDGYTVPTEIRSALMELSDIAAKNRVEEVDLYFYAIGSSEDEN